MTIKIGATTLQTAVPADLDGRCTSTMGCSAAEAHRLLEGSCIAGIVAKALQPLLVDAPPRHELARLIAAAGVPKIRKRVLRLYGAALRAKQKGPADGADQQQQTQG